MTTSAVINDECPACGGRGTQTVIEGPNLGHGPAGRFRVGRCNDCGLARLSPRPSNVLTAGYYPDEYHCYTAAPVSLGDRWRQRGLDSRRVRAEIAALRSMGYPLEDYGPVRGVVRRRVQRRRDAFERHISPPRGQMRILEVGCGTGEMLLRYRELGWSVRGIESSEAAANLGRQLGLEIEVGTVENSTLAKQAYDVILLKHVLEHLEDPLGVLERLVESLDPRSGRIVLEVPNVDAVGLTLFKEFWFALDLPRHLYHFSLTDLERFADRLGLSLSRVTFHSDGNWMKQSQSRARQHGPGELQRLVRVAVELGLGPKLQSLLEALSRLGRGDAISVWMDVQAD